MRQILRTTLICCLEVKMSKDEFWETIISIVVVLTAGCLLYAGWGQLVYGDWTCGFKDCVKVIGGEDE